MSKKIIKDWLKLKTVSLSIKVTLDMHRILSVYSILSLLTWVDTSYTVHNDTKSHMGECMSFDVGMPMPKSSKQKRNTKSTSKSEIVGASDYIPNVYG